MDAIEFFKRLSDKVKLYVDLPISKKDNSDESLEFSYKNRQYRISLQYGKYVIFYTKISDEEYRSEIPADLTFNPVFDINDNIEDFDVIEYLESAFYTNNELSLHL